MNFDDFDLHHNLDKINNSLIGLGFYQVFNNSLQTKEEAYFYSNKKDLIEMKNPLSDKMTHLRYSLIHGLMQNIEHNVNNGIHDLMLFEHGNTFSYSDSKRLGIDEGTRLPRPLVEFYYKDDSLNDPLVTESQISTFEWATETELGEIFEIALRTNDFLCGLLSAVNLTLVDFKIEIGRSFRSEGEKLIIADEISPDTCRLWDSKTKKRLDKDVFRLNEGSISIAYTEVADRFDLLPKNVRSAVR